jgi:hypothetical protein
MAKIPSTKIIEDALSEEFVDDYEYWDYVNSLEGNDWTNWDEHPWQWYMERDQRLSEGWHYVKINPAHKDVTVIYYLKSLDAKFKHSRNDFLIKDEKDAIMVALKYA